MVLASSKLLRKLGIDDVVDAVPVHLACGVWSAISAPFFAETTINTDPTYGSFRNFSVVMWMSMNM